MNEPSRKSALAYDELLGPLFFEPYAIEVAERIPSTVSVVLEIAAGTGRVTHHIRNRIPASATLIASDISEHMLNVAKEKLSNFNIDWQIIDAQQIPFDDNSIDIVVCCFGYMFVADKPKAFADAFRVLKPGGMLLFTTWDKLENNGISQTSQLVAKKYLEGEFPESCYTATSMSDESKIKPLLEQAGFSKISIEEVQKYSVSPTAKEAAISLVKTSLFFEEIKKLYPERRNEITTTLEKELSAKFGSSPMKAPISALITDAWK